MPCRLRLFVCGILLTSPLFWCGCSKPAVVNIPQPQRFPPPNGSNCTVHFRPDALGAAGTAPIPVNSSSHNGVQLTLAGKVVVSDEDWLVVRPLNSDSRQQWIARDAILYVEVQMK